MSFVNRMSKEVNCKIVYYDAGLCGKTANLNYVFAATKPESRGNAGSGNEASAEAVK